MPVMMLATSQTTTTRMLSVLAYTTVTGRHMATLLSVMMKSRRLVTRISTMDGGTDG